MSTLFQTLLAWLRAVGASVVLLSATLPASTRRDLVRAYAGNEVEVPDAPYPAITWTAGDRVKVLPLSASEKRVVRLDWIGRKPAEIVACLKNALREGGCAAVICNTVGRSQEVYRTLREASLVAECDLILFHARTPFGWRDKVERDVLARFGKGGSRDRPAIVVATQVIEQSLDLDFDFMISDLAPADLLLQRAGRLHRHHGRGRPALLAEPCLVVCVDEEEGLPDFGTDAYVYEPYILLRSFLALRNRSQLALPSETQSLIESVYGESGFEGLAAVWQERLDMAKRKLERDGARQIFEARKRLIKLPADERLLNAANADLEEDAPAIHATFQALTRLGPPCVPLVCLHLVCGGLNTDPDGSGDTIVLEDPAGNDLTGELVKCTVSVSDRRVFDYFTAQDAPLGWRKHPLLRDHRVAVFDNGACELPGTACTLRLTCELGLEISHHG